MESFLYGFALAFGSIWALEKLICNIFKHKTFTSKYLTKPTIKYSQTSQGEETCRKIAEKLTGYTFVKIRPRELINPETGRALELDCYNDNLQLAIEYQGRQHYEYVPIFHKDGRKDLSKQHERDCIKRQLCQQAGIKLIEVPYTVKDIESYLRKSFPVDILI